MNEEDDREYYQHRAEQELALAQKADVPAVVAAHYKLAEKYLDRVDGAAANSSEGVEPASETGSATISCGAEQPDPPQLPMRRADPESGS